MAACDVMLLGQVILGVFFTRAFLLPLAYVHMLKARYHSPASAVYHHAVWAVVGSKVMPVVQRAPRPVVRAVVAVQKWFTA